MEQEIVSLFDEDYLIPILNIRSDKQFRIYSFLSYFVWDVDGYCKILVNTQGNGVVMDDPMSWEDSYIGDENLWLHYAQIDDENPDFYGEHEAEIDEPEEFFDEEDE